MLDELRSSGSQRCAALLMALAVTGCSSGGAASQQVLPAASPASPTDTARPAPSPSSRPAQVVPTPSAATASAKTPATPAAPTLSTAAAGCSNNQVTNPVRAALEHADGRPASTTVPGRSYLGACGATSYAVASFQPSPTATSQQKVNFQDHGANPEFFIQHGSSSWTLVGSAPGPPYPPGQGGCVTFTRAPLQLRTLWNNCQAN